MSEGAAVFGVLVICAAVFLILARPFREAGPRQAAGTPRITPTPPPGPPIHTASLAAADGAGGRQAPARPAGDRTQLLDEKDRLFQALADLRFDYEAGKLSLEDFEEEDGRLRARAAALLHELGNGAPRNIPPMRA
jgi:hypothetical protein